LLQQAKYPRTGGYNPAVVTKLLENYRSHPVILKQYSDMCYASELIPRMVCDSIPDWVPDDMEAAYPLLVVGVNNGKVVKEGNNPSPYNPSETYVVEK
jgi:hypothetical protein